MIDLNANIRYLAEHSELEEEEIVALIAHSSVKSAASFLNIEFNVLYGKLRRQDFYTRNEGETWTNATGRFIALEAEEVIKRKRLYEESEYEASVERWLREDIRYED